MSPSQHLEVVLGLLGLADLIRDQVCQIESAGAHAICADPEPALAPLAAALERAARRLRVLIRSEPGEPDGVG